MLFPFQRPYHSRITRRLCEPRKFIQFLLGPRQVGKTTLVTQVLDASPIPSRMISADGVMGAGIAWLEQQWEAARIECRHAGNQGYILAVDEIQKIPGWSETVKKCWDADTRSGLPLKVILLGSSRLLLQQGLGESLAGRYETMHLGHWSYAEMKTAFGFTADQFVWFGGYPGAALLADEPDRWQHYIRDAIIEPAISRDILMLTRVDKPALLRHLFELGCLYSGQVLSYNKVLGQLLDAGNTTTLSHYLRLLETAGLLAGLEKFARDGIRKRSSSPKFMVFNTSFLSALQDKLFDVIRQNPAAWGRWVESAVGAHLLNGSLGDRYRIYYWRDGQHEVDFVLEYHGKTIGIEVKTGNPSGHSGMEAFRRQHQPDKMLMVGQDGIAWERFLEMDPLELFN